MYQSYCCKNDVSRVKTPNFTGFLLINTWVIPIPNLPAGNTIKPADMVPAKERSFINRQFFIF